VYGLIIAVLIASLAPPISWALWIKTSSEKAKYTALITILPALIVILDFLMCVQRSIMEWFWLNCGLSPLERLVVAFTMPLTLTSLSSTVLALLGIVKKRGLYFYLASLSSLSPLFIWFNYLNLNYPMLSPNPHLPPLGYGVVRSFAFFLYLPLYTVGALLSWSYLLDHDERILKVGLLLLGISLLLSSLWGLYGFGVPLPLTLYHLGLFFTFLSSLALLHDKSKLAALSFLSSFVLTLVLHRLLYISFGGMSPPFFGIQTSVGIAYGILALVGLINTLKSPMESMSRRFILIELSSIVLLIVGAADLASNALFASSVPVVLEAVELTLVLSALNLSLVGYLTFREKVGLVVPVTLLHPLLGFLASVAYPIYSLIKHNDLGKALMVAASLSMALMLLYSSSLYLFTPYKGSYRVSFKKSIGVSSLKYKGNVTVLEYHYLYTINATNTTRGLKIPLDVRINVFMGKYLAPNLINYFSWSHPLWRGLSTCALSSREFLGKPAPNVDYYLLMCVPLGIEGVLAPSLTIITLLYYLSKRRT